MTICSLKNLFNNQIIYFHTYILKSMLLLLNVLVIPNCVRQREKKIVCLFRAEPGGVFLAGSDVEETRNPSFFFLISNLFLSFFFAGFVASILRID